jgi:hypothetical protein
VGGARLTLLPARCACCVLPAQTRAAVYWAAGLDAATGQPANCSHAGRVRLRAEAGPGSGAHSTQLAVEWRGQQQPEALAIADTRV